MMVETQRLRLRTERTALDDDAFGALAFLTLAGLLLRAAVLPRLVRLLRVTVVLVVVAASSSV